MRLFFAALYCVVLTAFVWLNTSRPHPTSYVAVAPLEANRLVQPGDLKLAADGNSSIFGGYLKSAVAQGAVVTSNAVSPLPSLKPGPGSIHIVFPVDASLVAARALNAGSDVRLCAGKKDLPDTAAVKTRITAIICSAPDVGPCAAVTELPAAQAASIPAAFASSPIPHVRPLRGSCE